LLDRGLYTGSLLWGIDQIVLRGRAPWTLHRDVADYEKLKLAAECSPIDYPKPDGVLTFDKLSSVFVSNTNHEENQPSHLTLKDATIPVAVNWARYAGPEARYCPAGVYEWVDGATTAGALQINARRTASTARRATSMIRSRTSAGSRRRVVAGRCIRTCSYGALGSPLGSARSAGCIDERDRVHGPSPGHPRGGVSPSLNHVALGSAPALV
jgi:hypothetical protein